MMSDCSRGVHCRVMSVLLLELCLSAPALAGDFDLGRALYENHCQSCHEDWAHARSNRKVATLDGLRARVVSWQLSGSGPDGAGWRISVSMPGQRCWALRVQAPVSRQGRVYRPPASQLPDRAFDARRQKKLFRWRASGPPRPAEYSNSQRNAADA